jgi:hypothetical protein
MKRTSPMQKFDQNKRAKGSNAAVGARGTAICSPSTWLLLGLFLGLAGVGALAILEFTIWNEVPPALVGLWEIQEGPQQDSTFEFFRNGTLEVHLQEKKKDVPYKTQVHMRGRTLVEIKKDPFTREQKTSESLIRELTADTLILETEKGDVLKMVRIE